MERIGSQATGIDQARQMRLNDMAELEQRIADAREVSGPMTRHLVKAFEAQLDELRSETDEQRLSKIHHRKRAAASKEAEQEAKSPRNQNRVAFQALCGRRYHASSLDGFRVAPAHQDAQRAVLDKLRQCSTLMREMVSDGENLVFFGPAGTGKDHLAAAMAYEAIDAGFSVHWVNGAELSSRFRSVIDDKLVTEDKLLSELVAPDILLLSDPVLAGAPLTPYQAQMFYRVIDHRYRQMKPTWITVNVKTRSELDELLTTPIVDRLRHNAVVLSCNWESYRRIKGAEA